MHLIYLNCIEALCKRFMSDRLSGRLVLQSVRFKLSFLHTAVLRVLEQWKSPWHVFRSNIHFKKLNIANLQYKQITVWWRVNICFNLGNLMNLFVVGFRSWNNILQQQWCFKVKLIMFLKPGESSSPLNLLLALKLVWWQKSRWESVRGGQWNVWSSKS